jgi:hypothetical protein
MALPFFNAYKGSIGRFFQGDPTLVGYWQLDGNSLDNSGNGNNGTNNGATPAPGKFGQAMYFNGTSNYVSVPNSSSLSVTTAITIAAWIKPYNFTTESCVLAKWYQNGSNWSYVLYGKGTANAGFRLYNGSSNFVQLTGWTDNPIIEKWNFIVATWDNSSGIARVFVNNKLVGTQTGAFSTILTTANPVWIGNDGYNSYFAGSIDEVAVFSRALSLAEISQYYQWAMSQSRKTYYEVGGLLVPNTRRRLLLSM